VSRPRLSQTESNSHWRFSHRLKCKHADDERRDSKYITISQMPSTRSGNTNYKVGPEHHGRYARAAGTFLVNKKKRPTIEPRAARFHTSEQGCDRQKRIRISNPNPPTPTKEQLIQLPRLTRNSRPTCLHYGIDKRRRELAYPEHFFANTVTTMLMP
jgi:hypothetical protein